MKSSPSTLFISVEDTVHIGVRVTRPTPYRFDYSISAMYDVPTFVWQVTNQSNAPSYFFTSANSSGY